MHGGWSRTEGGANLDEADIGSLLTEALTADVEAVLADETGTVRADAAIEESLLAISSGNIQSLSEGVRKGVASVGGMIGGAEEN